MRKKSIFPHKIIIHPERLPLGLPVRFPFPVRSEYLSLKSDPTVRAFGESLRAYR